MLTLLSVAALAVAALSGAFLLGAGTSSVEGEGHGGGDQVRVQARAHEDGRVEVAVQHNGGEGWGETLLPDQRFLSPDAPLNVWLASSAVGIEGVSGMHGSGARFCMVDHGHPRDQFWQMTHSAAQRAAKDLGVQLDNYNGLGEGEAAAVIRECVADGAAAIAVTLADPDAVADAIAEANEAGVAVVTFNSGGHLAEELGGAIHVGPGDYQGGVAMGEELNARGISGLVVCLIHEAANTGLEARCDGLEDGYTGGAVERMLTLDWAGDTEAAITPLFNRMVDETQEAPAAWIGLNGQIGSLLVALSRIEPLPFIATFGFGGNAILHTITGEIEFFMWDAPLEQGYQTVMAMQYLVHLSKSFPRVTIGDVAQRIGTIVIDIPMPIFGRSQATYLGQNLVIDNDLVKIDLPEGFRPPGS